MRFLTGGALCNHLFCIWSTSGHLLQLCGISSTSFSGFSLSILICSIRLSVVRISFQSPGRMPSLPRTSAEGGYPVWSLRSYHALAFLPILFIDNKEMDGTSLSLFLYYLRFYFPCVCSIARGEIGASINQVARLSSRFLRLCYVTTVFRYNLQTPFSLCGFGKVFASHTMGN